jgi:hypothetical protein
LSIGFGTHTGTPSSRAITLTRGELGLLPACYPLIGPATLPALGKPLVLGQGCLVSCLLLRKHFLLATGLGQGPLMLSLCQLVSLLIGSLLRAHRCDLA